MFLAIREIRQSPARFVLISLVVFLVSYLAFFLTGLAHGLARSFSEVVDSWPSSHVVVTEDSNNNILASRITADQLNDAQDTLPEITPLYIRPAVMEIPGVDEDTDGKDDHRSAFLLGVEHDSSAAPLVSEGTFPSKGNEILVDSSLKRRGFTVGNTLNLPDSETVWIISGFTDHQQYQASPVLFINRQVFADTFDFALVTRTATVSAAALLLPEAPTAEQAAHLHNVGLAVLTTDELKNEIPGYRAQTLTFVLMIASLIVIIAFVLGIFIYVLTLQKLTIFGIMKAQGVPTSYILISGVIQTLLLTVVGVALGLLLSLLTGALLIDKVPFYASPLLFGGVSLAFIIFTIFGGLAPIRTVSRIDPVEAIS